MTLSCLRLLSESLLLLLIISVVVGSAPWPEGAQSLPKCCFVGGSRGRQERRMWVHGPSLSYSSTVGIPGRRQQYLSSGCYCDTRRKASTNEDDNDPFMASLEARVQQIRASQLPLVILDDEFLLPRQVLDWTIPAAQVEIVMGLIRTRIQAEMPTFGVVGRSRRSGTICPMGVEVEIVQNLLPVTNTETTTTTTEPCWRLKIRGTRVFRIQAKTLGKAAQGWQQAPVEFVDWQTEETAEDVFSMAVALQRAREFTEPNVSMNEEQSLIDMWIELALTKEITPGQIDRLVQELGPRPSWKNPSDCAFWVAALINPVPTLGVAWEIRSRLLLAKTADERTQIALNGIWNSIQHMEAADNRFRQIKE